MFSLASLESVPLFGEKLVGIISYLKKHFSLKEREKNIEKKERVLKEKENEIKELIEIKNDNIKRIKHLIKFEISRFTPGLRVPRLEFDVRITNYSIFDLKLTNFKYDIDFVVGSSYRHVIENQHYFEQPQIPRQGEISFTHTCDPPSGMVGEIINQIENMSRDSETQWNFKIQCEFEGHGINKFRKSDTVTTYKSCSWIMRVLER